MFPCRVEVPNYHVHCLLVFCARYNQSSQAGRGEQGRGRHGPASPSGGLPSPCSGGRWAQMLQSSSVRRSFISFQSPAWTLTAVKMLPDVSFQVG
eukprot:3062832-Rhodomonas_salina.1